MADMKPRTGKPPLALLPRPGLEVAAAGMEHGAGKYWPRNYRDCNPDEAGTYIHAILRHANAMAHGEFIDEESGVPHVGLLIAGAMIFAEITQLGYVEPKVMVDNPDRKARINSMQALFGPRPDSLPTNPADLKEDPPSDKRAWPPAAFFLYRPGGRPEGE